MKKNISYAGYQSIFLEDSRNQNKNAIKVYLAYKKL